MNKKKSFGKLGEALAVKYLKEKNYQIVDQNKYCGHGEIDIIALKLGKYHFVEVRTRTSGTPGNIEESIGFIKRKRFARTIERLAIKNNWADYQADVLFVMVDKENRQVRIKHLQAVEL